MDKNTEKLEEIYNSSKDEISKFADNGMGVGEDFEQRVGVRKNNIEYKDEMHHLEKAHEATGTGEFNFQNSLILWLGRILAIFLLIPSGVFILKYDLKQIMPDFSYVLEHFMFTTILLLTIVIAVRELLLEFLFLGMFNKKNKETRRLEKIVFFILLSLHLGGNGYFAFLVTGSQNFKKKEEILKSEFTTDGILSKGIKKDLADIDNQIQTLLNEKKILSETIKNDDKQIETITNQITSLTSKRKLTRSQISNRRALYQNKKSFEEDKAKAQERSKEIDKELKELRGEKTGLTEKLANSSSKIDKELDDNSFWRIVYTLIILILFEILSHIHWLAYYRVIKNAPQDLVEDYRKMMYSLDWQKLFRMKVDEITGEVGNMIIQDTDRAIRGLKIIGKSADMMSAGNAVTMIEQTKNSLAVTDAVVTSIKENTKGVIHLASTIKRDGFGHKQGYAPAGEKQEPPQYTERFKKPNKTLKEATKYLCREFSMPTPNLLLGVGIDGGYCDILEELIVIGDKEQDKLEVLAHEFVHYMGFIEHDNEFREMEKSIMKGLKEWLKTQQKPY